MAPRLGEVGQPGAGRRLEDDLVDRALGVGLHEGERTVLVGTGEGLDLVEYGTLVYPEMGVMKEQVLEPDGTLVETVGITQRELTNGHSPEFEKAPG